MPVGLWLVGTVTGAAGLTCLALAGEAAAMTLTVAENEIRSLANAPAVRAAEGLIDNAARPAIFLDLEFANDCLATTGTSLRLLSGTPDGPAPVMIVGQRIPPDGCPDIFQPVRASVLALLPLDLTGRSVTLIARPATAEDAATVTLKARGEPPAAGTILEVSPEASVIVPRIEEAGLEPGAAGYRLVGRLLISGACADADVKAEVLEVPDAAGSPSSDVVVITAPTSCIPAGTEEARAVSIEVRTPQPPGGRRVLWLNAGGRPLTLGP